MSHILIRMQISLFPLYMFGEMDGTKKSLDCKLWIGLPFKLLGIMDHDDRFWYIRLIS